MRIAKFETIIKWRPTWGGLVDSSSSFEEKFNKNVKGKYRRGGYRGVVTKLAKEAYELLHSTDVDIQRCEVISNQLEEKMNILNNINEEILGVCEVSEIGGEIEEAALVTDRILNTKSKIEAAKRAQNTANVSVVASSTVSVESQIENSPNTDETRRLLRRSLRLPRRK